MDRAGLTERVTETPLKLDLSGLKRGLELPKIEPKKFESILVACALSALTYNKDLLKALDVIGKLSSPRVAELKKEMDDARDNGVPTRYDYVSASGHKYPDSELGRLAAALDQEVEKEISFSKLQLLKNPWKNELRYLGTDRYGHRLEVPATDDGFEFLRREKDAYWDRQKIPLEIIRKDKWEGPFFNKNIPFDKATLPNILDLLREHFKK